MIEARRWLDAHHRGAPPRLRSAMDRALAGTPTDSGDSVPECLAAAGLAMLRRVVEGGGDRPSATELLAADALLTAACEAAAEAGQETLDALTARLVPARFAELVPGAPS